MAENNSDKETGEPVINHKHETALNENKSYVGTDFNFKHQVVWTNVVVFFIMHLIGLHAVFLILTLKVSLITLLFNYAYLIFCVIGVTGGAHRLWTHRAYQANLPLKILLMLGQTAALQNHIYEWSRDHRAHHKFTDTDADPHNSRRGFFFCHMGWLMSKKHPEVISKGKGIDLSDLEADPVVRFQKKYYRPLILIFNQMIPTFIPWYFFGEPLWNSFAVSMVRYLISLHGTWAVNSAAHLWGTKPYDKNINPTESPFVIRTMIGEGFHNYHHLFPWDYKAAELGDYGFNWTTAVIDFMAKIGWATDLKTASEKSVRKRAMRTGDGTWIKGKQFEINNNNTWDCELKENLDSEEMIWGWGDKDLTKNDMKLIDRRK